MDEAKKTAALIGGVLFAVAAALLHAHAFPKLDSAFQIALTVLGALGIGALPPVFGSSAAPQGLQQPDPDARTKQTF